MLSRTDRTSTNHAPAWNKPSPDSPPMARNVQPAFGCCAAVADTAAGADNAAVVDRMHIGLAPGTVIASSTLNGRQAAASPADGDDGGRCILRSMSACEQMSARVRCSSGRPGITLREVWKPWSKCGVRRCQNETGCETGALRAGSARGARDGAGSEQSTQSDEHFGKRCYYK